MTKITDKKSEEEKEKKVKEKTKKIEKQDSRDQKIKELTETLQRVQAEFENYKKRTEKQDTAHKEYAEAEIVKKLLPVLDSFEQAINNNAQDAEKLKKGIEMLYAQLHSIMKQAGLKPIKALGESFDAYKHEVVMKEESEKDNKVLEELQKGYTFKDKVIRHSKVKVGKKEEKHANIKANTHKGC